MSMIYFDLPPWSRVDFRDQRSAQIALLSATGGSDGPSKSYAARRRGGDPRRLTLAPADKPGYRPRPSKHFMSVFKGGR